MPRFFVTHSIDLFMKKLLFTPLLLLLLPFGLKAQIDEGLPPNPTPGQCYVRCVTPDVWEEQEVQVMVRPAYTELEVIPAEYEEVEERIMVKPASKQFVYVPAVFEEYTEEMEVVAPYNKVTVVPATFNPSTEDVVLQPAYSQYEYQTAMENCPSDDPRDCMVLCYVEYPEQRAAISTELLGQDATTTTAPDGREMMTITKQRIAEPARVDEVEIPAEYETVTRRVLVKDETTREITVPAEYRTETVRVLKEKGGVTVWEEIDCELTSFTPLPVYYEFGSARLTAESRRIIDERLLALMEAKPLIRVELNSHTDSRGSKSANQDLSQRRAQSVVDYLISKGISRDRLVAKGYGEDRPVNRCVDGVECTEEEHQANRRTEFRVLGG